MSDKPFYIESSGGAPSRSLTYMKVIDLMDQLMDQMAVMAHLHNTEGNDMDKLLAKGWLGMTEMMKMVRYQITELAKSKLS